MPFVIDIFLPDEIGTGVLSNGVSQSVMPEFQKGLFGNCADTWDVNECVFQHKIRLWDIYWERSIRLSLNLGPT